jgi:hypothetical protein
VLTWPSVGEVTDQEDELALLGGRAGLRLGA